MGGIFKRGIGRASVLSGWNRLFQPQSAAPWTGDTGHGTVAAGSGENRGHRLAFVGDGEGPAGG